MSEGDAPKLMMVFREGSGLAAAARRLAEMTPEEIAMIEQFNRDFSSFSYPWHKPGPVDVEAYRTAWIKAFGGLPDMAESNAAWLRAGERDERG